MSDIRCIIAETQRHLDHAVRVRFEVFARELGYLDTKEHAVPRELDCFDTLATTLHLIAYDGDIAVGTLRLLLPNPEVAATNGTSFGLSVESQFDLAPLAAAGLRLAETSRYCVLATHRHSMAVAELHAAAVHLSRVLGVGHWIATANTETDGIEDARLIQQVARERGFVRNDLSLAPRLPSPAPASPKRPFFDDHARSEATRSPARSRLPRTLDMYARRMRARFVGPPVYDTRFRMCALPLLASVAEQRTVQRAKPPVFPHPGSIAA
ncbi:GNAT family N-acetyltransferase [Polyangium sp. 15x6]|uniref:GNAT family N-acetyltransferase n=1 Tax=Polyangium sp. 15x6 TaxID=3042687 RepID=UPI00249A3CE6|nr:GNAT family N-acetyltransferase [Polyangium sp. 15x6]MDI3283785.1 GNAT family N-acetyltransferase [Polyangium sp. 15x6]